MADKVITDNKDSRNTDIIGNTENIRSTKNAGYIENIENTKNAGDTGNNENTGNTGSVRDNTDNKSNRLSKLMPLLSACLGFAEIGVLTVFMALRLQDVSQRIMAIAVVIIYVSWLLLEMRITAGEKGKEAAPSDNKTLEMCVVAKFILIALTLGFVRGINTGNFIAAVVLMISGIAFREYAISNIGKHYSHRIREEGIHIVQDGAYGIIRHPAYLGTLVAHTGFVVGLFSPLALSGLLIWYAVVVYRTIVEDRCLIQLSEYQQYSRKVRYRLFPGIW